MSNRSVLSVAAFFLVFGLLPALADTQIIPQVADGAGWSTTIVLANKTTSTQSVTLSFNMDTSNSATIPWAPPFVEAVSLASISLPAGSTLFLHTPGTAASLTQGWGQLDAATGVTGYAIFTQRVPGQPAQDGTAPAVSAASRILVPFDNTSGLVSAFAVANPTNAAVTVQVNIRTSDSTLSGSLPALPAKGQTTFLLKDVFGGTANKSGLAEFYVTSGSISVIALRANGIAFTAAPVYLQSGNPIIGAPNSPQNPVSQTQVIPQVADGKGWATTIVLTNTTTGDLPVTLNFKQAVPNGVGATNPWSPPFQTSVPASFNVPAGSSIFLRTPGNAIALSQGWAELVADPRVTGYAIFTQQSGGRAQDSTAPAVSASSRILVPFDNTSGLIMAIALVNPNPSAETVSVNFRMLDGTTSTNTVVPALQPQGQIAFLMRDPLYFPETANKSGLAEFYVSSGTISIIALRANGTAITSAPVYFETGTPIIATGGGGGGGGGTGNIVAGGFTVAKVTVTLPSTGTNTSESIGGGFSSYTQAEWQYPFSAPTFGACSVIDITNPAKAPYLPDAYLDAGTITVSGPNLPSGTIIPKSITQTGPSYDFRAATGSTLADGGTYTISGSGGTQVGPFTASATLPQSFTVTNWDAITGINRANGLTVNWSGTGFNTVVITATGQSLATTETVTVSCMVAGSLGTFSIPQGALAMLFPTQVATLTVTATTVTSGIAAQLRTTAQTLVPSLVGGGQVNYGDVGGQVSVLKSLSIQ
jgi:hypothetical protein